MTFVELFFLIIVPVAAGAGMLALVASALPADFAAAAFSQRSNHVAPARQIGGLAVVPAVLVLLALFGPHFGLGARFIACTAAASVILLLVGHLDDRKSLSVATRVIAQLAACTIAVLGLGPQFHLVSTIAPLWLEIPLLILALMWFINLTNFMDGLDLMVVSGLGIPLAVVALFAVFGLAGTGTGALAALLAGALAGFGLFNRPPARIFLGDAGSLPVGLIAGLAFFKVAFDTHLTVGFMLPLYFSADATVTVVVRLLSGEPIFTGHSRHAYQLARRKGWNVWHVIAWVSALNLFVALCALAGALTSGDLVTDIAFVVAAVAVGFVLRQFRRRPAGCRSGQLPR